VLSLWKVKEKLNDILHVDWLCNVAMTMTIELAPDQAELKAGTELNPFAEGVPSGQYFSDAYRTLSLNKLIHLAPYSELLVVTGASGSGRTCLVSEFVSKAAETWRTAMVSCRESDSESDLLLKIIEQIEMPLITTEESRGVLLDSLARFLESLGRSARRAIIVLDDSDNLSEGHLAMLAVLLTDYRSEDALSIIFVASEDFPERMRAQEQLHRRLVYNLELQGMSLEQLRDYIGHRLVVAGMVSKMALFSADVLADILVKSGGMPGRVNLLAKDLLDNKTLATRHKVAKQGGRWRWVLVILGGVVAATLLLFQNEINQFIAQQELDQPQADVITLESIDVVPQDLVEPPLPMVELDNDDVLSDELDSQTIALAVVSELPNDEVVEPQESSTASGEAELIPTVTDVEVKANDSTPLAIELASPEPEPEPAVIKPWMLTQPAQNYTMQLMALKDEQKVRDFVIKNKIEDQSEVFFIYRASGRLAALVYGSYESKEEARAASLRLPRSWRVKSPWLRTFGDVQKEYNSGEQ